MRNTIPASENVSRNTLLNTARDLFYEQGYAATTLSQISRRSGVNNGLITYYFKSKVILGDEIYDKCVAALRGHIIRYLELHPTENDMAIQVAVLNRILLAEEFRNPNFGRFVSEYQQDHPRGKKSIHSKQRQEYTRMQKEQINPTLSDEAMQLYSLCGSAMRIYIIRSFQDGHLEGIDPEYIKEYLLRTLFFMLALPKKKAEQLIRESGEIERELHVRIGEGFHMSFS